MTIAVVDFETDDSFSISFTPLLTMKFGEFDQTNIASSPENVLASVDTGTRPTLALAANEMP